MTKTLINATEVKYNRDVGEAIDRILEFDFEIDKTDLQDCRYLHDELGIDSVDIHGVIAKIETQLSVEIPDAYDVSGIKTLGDLKVVVTVLQTKEKTEGALNY